VAAGVWGAFASEPLWQPQAPPENRDYAALGLAAQAVFDGQTEDVLQELIRVGSSGGARPKAQIWMAPDDPRHCRTVAQPGDEAWLVKYTSRHLPPLGHEEGLCEAAYLQLAERAGLQPCAWRLLDAPAKSGARRWLALKRFDCTTQGRHHLHSASGLLHADYRLPSLDYIDLLKMSKQLCRAPGMGLAPVGDLLALFFKKVCQLQAYVLAVFDTIQCLIIHNYLLCILLIYVYDYLFL